MSLGPPTGLKAAQLSTWETKLSWNQVAQAPGYDVWAGPSGPGKARIGDTKSTEFLDTAGVPGQTFYQVGVVMESAFSNEASATPTLLPPMNLVAGPAAAGGIQLSWTPPVGGKLTNIYMGTTAGGEATTPLLTGVPGSTVVVTKDAAGNPLTPPTVYFFKVTATD